MVWGHTPEHAEVSQSFSCAQVFQALHHPGCPPPHPFIPRIEPSAQMSRDWVGTVTWTQPSGNTSWGWVGCCISCHKPLAQDSACGHLIPQK